MKEIILKVEGIKCDGCEKRIQNAVNNINGVKEVIANHSNGTVKVILDKDIDIKEIVETIEDIGFDVKED